MQSVLWPDFSLRRHQYVTSGQEQLSTWRHEWRKVVALWCGAYHTRCVVVAQIQFSNCKVWHEGKKCISLHLKQCASATSWRATEVKLSLLLLWSTLPQCLQIYLQSYDQHCMQIQLPKAPPFFYKLFFFAAAGRPKIHNELISPASQK